MRSGEEMISERRGHNIQGKTLRVLFTRVHSFKATVGRKGAKKNSMTL